MGLNYPHIQKINNTGVMEGKDSLQDDDVR